MTGILDQCRVRGLSAIACPDPLRPEETEAVLIPEAGVGFVATTRRGPIRGRCGVICGWTPWLELTRSVPGGKNAAGPSTAGSFCFRTPARPGHRPKPGMIGWRLCITPT